MNILIINNVVPDPDRAGAELRLALLIQSLRNSGNSIALVATRESSGSTIQNDTITLFDDSAFASSCDISMSSKSVLVTVVANRFFDLAILPLWFWESLSIPELYLELLNQLTPMTAIAVLSDDRHGERQAQIAELDPCLVEVECSIDYQAREREAYLKSDLVIVLNERERQNVLALAPACECFVIPFVVRSTGSTIPFEDRSGICFLGNFRNHATRMSFDVLLHQVLPLVRSTISDMQLFVGGAHSASMHISKSMHVTVEGQVTNLADFFNQRRLFVCPTTYGTGITTKVALARSYGIPVITTPSGIQSLSIGSYKEIVVNKTPIDIARSTVIAYTEKKIWEALAREGMMCEINYTVKSVDQLLQELLQWVSGRDCSNRSRDFVWSISKGLQIAAGQESRRGKRHLSSRFLKAGMHMLNRGDPDSALKQMRHAISISKTWLKRDVRAADVYNDILAGLLEAYSALGDEAGTERVQREIRLYQQFQSLEASDEA